MKKILFATPFNLQNLQKATGRKGTTFYTAEGLKSIFHVSYVQIKDENKVYYKLKELAYRKALKKNYLLEREPHILKGYARQIERAFLENNADCLFSTSSLPIAYLPQEIPAYFWTDATFAGMHEYYPEFSNICKETIWKGNVAEQAALDRCRLAVYSSDWAAKTAIESYNVKPDKVKVIPFGANTKSSPTIEEINSIIMGKSRSVCKLLFIGADWSRKGGETACQVVEALNLAGFKAELILVGCQPNFKSDIPDYIKPAGFLNRLSREGSDKLEELIKNVHFLILPSTADCSPAVIREAYVYGLPVISTNTGGIPTLVEDGVNGMLLARDASIDTYCQSITQLYSNISAYKKMAFSAFKTYQNSFNWKNATERLGQLILNSL